jgi:hypothetical protein
LFHNDWGRIGLNIVLERPPRWAACAWHRMLKTLVND